MFDLNLRGLLDFLVAGKKAYASMRLFFFCLHIVHCYHARTCSVHAIFYVHRTCAVQYMLLSIYGWFARCESSSMKLFLFTEFIISFVLHSVFLIHIHIILLTPIILRPCIHILKLP